ncbi:MAG: hypothetical protein SFZ03_03560 [Candidatus Melainabacteria bacterium]|nr:hypothetical protein [Candidatus Melainabacteria bacterium]
MGENGSAKVKDTTTAGGAQSPGNVFPEMSGPGWLKNAGLSFPEYILIGTLMAITCIAALCSLQ